MPSPAEASGRDDEPSESFAQAAYIGHPGTVPASSRKGSSTGKERLRKSSSISNMLYVRPSHLTVTDLQRPASRQPMANNTASLNVKSSKYSSVWEPPGSSQYGRFTQDISAGLP